MAAVVQKVKTAKTTETASMTKQQSKVFVKRMLALSVSTICYMRNMFPEKAFQDRKIEGDMKVKILSQNQHNGATSIINWMNGIFDAIDKEYLQSMMLVVVSDPTDSNSVLETYTYNFAYKNGDIQATASVESDEKTKQGLLFPTTDETKKSAKKLLQNLIVLTHNMSSLPKDVYLTVRLLYYDDKTPADYQPPGFVTVEEKDVLRNVTEQIRIKVGNLTTPYYDIKMRAIAPRSEYEEAQSSSQRNSQKTKREEEDEEKNMETEEKSCSLGAGVNCSCQDANVDDELMILCSVCNFSQHAICYRVTSCTDQLKDHVCCKCCDQNSESATDPTLLGLDDEERKDLCLWRRTLKHCSTLDTVNNQALCKKFKCTRKTAQKLLNRLQAEDVLRFIRNGVRTSKKVDRETLEKILHRELNPNKEEASKEESDCGKDEDARPSVEDESGLDIVADDEEEEAMVEDAQAMDVDEPGMNEDDGDDPSFDPASAKKASNKKRKSSSKKSERNAKSNDDRSESKTGRSRKRSLFTDSGLGNDEMGASVYDWIEDDDTTPKPPRRKKMSKARQTARV